MKEYKRYDKNTFHLPRKETGVKVLEGNYCDKTGQIAAVEGEEYYGFTTNAGIKVYNVKGE